MFFVSQATNPSEFFNIQDCNSNDTLKKDVSLSDPSLDSSNKSDSHELDLEQLYGPTLHEDSSQDDLIDPGSQALAELREKANNFSGVTVIDNNLFPQSLDDQSPSNHPCLSDHMEENENLSESCDKDFDPDRKLCISTNIAKLEDSSFATKHCVCLEPYVLRDKIIVLKCSDSKVKNNFVSSVISVNKPLLNTAETENLNPIVDERVTTSLRDDLSSMKVICFQSDISSDNENSTTASCSTVSSDKTNFTQELLFRTIDVGILSMIPIDSVVVGNIALLPQTKSYKFQVFQGNETIKSKDVNVEPSVSFIEGIEGRDAPSIENASITENSLSESRRPYKCDLCKATFSRLGNYTRHKKVHDIPARGDTRFQCEVCAKKFIQRCDLARHMHIHSGTEPHRCSSCGKGYLRHSDLLTHQRFHNREKPFACPQCTKGFSQKGDLNRHLRSIHLHLKPLVCHHCHKKFVKEATLLRHMQDSHRDFLLESVIESNKGQNFEANEQNISDVSNE